MVYLFVFLLVLFVNQAYSIEESCEEKVAERIVKETSITKDIALDIAKRVCNHIKVYNPKNPTPERAKTNELHIDKKPPVAWQVEGYNYSQKSASKQQDEKKKEDERKVFSGRSGIFDDKNKPVGGKKDSDSKSGSSGKSSSSGGK